MHWKLSYYLIGSEPIVNERFQILYSTRTVQRRLLFTALVENILKNNVTAISEEIVSKMVASKVLILSDEKELTTIISRNTTAHDNTKYYRNSTYCPMIVSLTLLRAKTYKYLHRRTA